MYQPNFNNLPYANQVSAQDFDPILTNLLTDDSLSDETHSNALNILISAEGENLMHIPLKFENDVRRKALIDTGACANEMPADFYEKLLTQRPNSHFRITTSITFKCESSIRTYSKSISTMGCQIQN